MRITLLLMIALAITVVPACKKKAARRETDEAPAPVLVAASERTVEAGCATCIFDMEGVAGCKLAVKIDGKAYLVSGKSMDDLGDAHAEDGLCNIARKAEVTGKLDGDRFAVTAMSLLPK